MKVKNLVVQDTWMSMMKEMNDNQVGLLMKAIITWRDGNEVMFNDEEMSFVFNLIKGDLTKQEDRYSKRVKLNRVNGLKGGRPKSK